MNRSFSENVTFQFAFLGLVVLLSRLPFLWAGFGAEEDSWLLALTAKNMALSGNYEMSRAPGHPLQEYLYALLYNNGLDPFITNLMSAIASVVATVFFALAIRQLGLKHYLFAGFAFAFTPVIYISSTYTIDYMLALAFVMASFYFITKLAVCPPLEGAGGGLLLASGISLGIAIGFRLTSAAMLIPCCIILLPSTKLSLKNIIIFSASAILIALLTYLPVLKVYGYSFFHYSDQFPYPNLSKIIYKMSIGVFGAAGMAAILLSIVQIILNKSRSKEKILSTEIPRNLFWAAISVIVIYTISYFRLPQKSAYLIPAVPFITLAFAYYLSSQTFKIFCTLLTVSSFLFSINLTDPLRGSAHSSLAMKFKIAGQKIFIDPLSGPVFSDYTKRLNKIAYTEEIFQKLTTEANKTVLICGWWHNELLVRSWNGPENPNVVTVFYIDQPAIEKYISQGYNVYFLPEQDLYNDQFSQMKYTNSAARPYM